MVLRCRRILEPGEPTVMFGDAPDAIAPHRLACCSDTRPRFADAEEKRDFGDHLALCESVAACGDAPLRRMHAALHCHVRWPCAATCDMDFGLRPQRWRVRFVSCFAKRVCFQEALPPRA